MATLLGRLKARLANPELTANFNREVSRTHVVTAEDERNYDEAQSVLRAVMAQP